MKKYVNLRQPFIRYYHKLCLIHLLNERWSFLLVCCYFHETNVWKKNTSIEGFSFALNYCKFKMYKRIIAAKGYQQLSLTTISFCLKWLHTRQMYSSGGGRLFLLQGDGFYFKWCRITVFQYLVEKNGYLTCNTIITLSVFKILWWYQIRLVKIY